MGPVPRFCPKNGNIWPFGPLADVGCSWNFPKVFSWLRVHTQISRAKPENENWLHSERLNFFWVGLFLGYEPCSDPKNGKIWPFGPLADVGCSWNFPNVFSWLRVYIQISRAKPENEIWLHSERLKFFFGWDRFRFEIRSYLDIQNSKCHISVNTDQIDL